MDAHETGERLRLQDDPDVVGWQYIRTIDGANGEVKLGGTAYLRDGLSWDEVFRSVTDRTITQFINGSVIVFRKARRESADEAPGFHRF
jgi:hypothetical protein